MAIEFKNRKGHTYYIKKRKTKTGKTTYTVTKTKSKDCVDEVPQGFEVHEKPENGQMLLRKKIPSKFTLKELNTIKQELQKNDTIGAFKIDVRGNELTIYTAEIMNGKTFGDLFPFMKHKSEQIMEMVTHYSAMMKVLIVEEISREYVFQRYCFRGSIDDWITIGISPELKNLAKKYIHHLGKESFYELSYNFGE